MQLWLFLPIHWSAYGSPSPASDELLLWLLQLLIFWMHLPQWYVFFLPAQCFLGWRLHDGWVSPISHLSFCPSTTLWNLNDFFPGLQDSSIAGDVEASQPHAWTSPMGAASPGRLREPALPALTVSYCLKVLLPSPQGMGEVNSAQGIPPLWFFPLPF